LNLPRYEFPEADEPFLATPTGPAWLNVEVQPVGMPGNLPSAAQNQPGYYSANGPQNGGTQAQPAQPPAQPKPTATVPAGKKKPVASAKKAEQRAFTAFMTKRAGTGLWRDFTFEELDADIGEAANRLAAAGDVDAVKALFELNDGS
jgi:hypothetical protein